MKKVIGLIVLAIMVILPMNVHAGYSWKFEEIEGSQTNTTMKVELSITITEDTTLAKVAGSLKMEHLTLANVDYDKSLFSYILTGDTLMFTPSAPLTAGTYKIATLTFTKDSTATAADNCYVTFRGCVDDNGSYVCEAPEITVEETYNCKIVDGVYYGKDGNEVTEEVYNAECVNNPQTGSFLPYVVIAAGIALAVGVFTISRKNNTLYKI